MRKIVLLSCLFFLACGGHDKFVTYTPGTFNGADPIQTIKSTIEQQPPAFAYVPALVEVTDISIKLYMAETTHDKSHVIGRLPNGHMTVWTIRGTAKEKIVPLTIFYKNIGEMKLAFSKRYNLWHVEINDKAGYYLYWVYTFDETEAKNFIDAMLYLKNE